MHGKVLQTKSYVNGRSLKILPVFLVNGIVYIQVL